MTEPNLGLKTARVPIGRLHYHKAKHREGKVLRRTHHDRSGSQLPVIRKRVPEKHLGSYHLCDYRPPEPSFACGAVHCRLFQQLRTVDPRHRKLKASDNSYRRTFLYLAAGAGGGSDTSLFRNLLTRLRVRHGESNEPGAFGSTHFDVPATKSGPDET